MNQAKSENPEQIKSAIREAGLRATPARIATLKLLHGATSPLTHAEVSKELEDLGVDKATVFRNLNDMARGGFAASDGIRGSSLAVRVGI